MPEPKPIYIKLLIAVLALYIISSCIMHADIYRKLGEIEHKMMHITAGNSPCYHK